MAVVMAVAKVGVAKEGETVAVKAVEKAAETDAVVTVAAKAAARVAAKATANAVEKAVARAAAKTSNAAIGSAKRAYHGRGEARCAQPFFAKGSKASLTLHGRSW